MRIIPAIDIIEGKCVRLSQGDYARKKVYNEDPLEVAMEFQDHGIEYLHLVDLDGAKSRQVVNHKVLERLASKTSLKIDFGGGVKSNKDLDIAFESGAQQVTAGSVAARDPDLVTSWLAAYGPERIILGADAADGKIAVQGWTEKTDLELLSFLEDYIQKGMQYAICTDISKDGMLEGPSFELYEQIMTRFPELSLIASGGVSGMDDLYRLREMGCQGAIVGKALYEKNISLKQLEAYILDNNKITRT